MANMPFNCEDILKKKKKTILVAKVFYWVCKFVFYFTFVSFIKDLFIITFERLISAFNTQMAKKHF
jgi:hypothetical protein